MRWTLLLGALLASHAVGQGTPQHAGEGLYRNGVLASGQPLTGRREGNLPLTGSEAACINCHRRSGLGEVDGNIKIPPIAGPYLTHPPAKSRDNLTIPFIEGMRPDRGPYTPDSLARAIREGIGRDGQALNYLMPRYGLGDEDMAALVGYLQGMRPLRAPGVAGSVVHFATIVTPDADPLRRELMLTVLNQFFSEQNAFALSRTPNLNRPETTRSIAKRRWQLHVWSLTGAPTGWVEQLREHAKHEPVYAAISGLGGRDWSPVHHFCEEASLPCLFPNVDLPVVAEQDIYSLYYSRGVLLEADLMAQQLESEKAAAPSRRVVQVFRADDVGAPAAMALREALQRAGIVTVERSLGNAGAKPLAEALRSFGSGDALVLWLRPADVALLANVPMRASHVLMSGLMGGLDATPLPGNWREATRLTYPVELPDKRTVAVDYALGWLAHNRIQVVDARVQVDTYIACRLTLETLNHLAGAFVPDYLVESLEGMLEHQVINGYYPRLALAPRERFASKGGYMVHFAGESGSRLTPDTEWRVPLGGAAASSP